MEVALFHGSVTAAAIALRHTDEITLIKCLIFYNHIYLLWKGINPGGGAYSQFLDISNIYIMAVPLFLEMLGWIIILKAVYMCLLLQQLICIQRWWCPTHQLLQIVMFSHQELDTCTTISSFCKLVKMRPQKFNWISSKSLVVEWFN
jgi:hypothetical protein